VLSVNTLSLWHNLSVTKLEVNISYLRTVMFFVWMHNHLDPVVCFTMSLLAIHSSCSMNSIVSFICGWLVML